MKMIFLGPPGSGKGTLAKIIVDKLGYAHLSTGDILRENIKNDTALGRLAKPLIDAGKFVPDDIIIKVVIDKLNQLKDNFILDGFPRNLNQAKELDKNFNVDKVVLLDLPYEVILNRAISRRVCSNNKCKEIYNTKNYFENTCEKCGSTLFHREDDKEEVFKDRYENYLKVTQPLIDYYTKANKLVRLKMEETPSETYKNFEQLIEGVKKCN